MRRLIRTCTDSDQSTLDDRLRCAMATIEDGLLGSGFIPETDYTRRDLFLAAMPLIYSSYKADVLWLTSSWPSHDSNQGD